MGYIKYGDFKGLTLGIKIGRVTGNRSTHIRSKDRDR